MVCMKNTKPKKKKINETIQDHIIVNIGIPIIVICAGISFSYFILSFFGEDYNKILIFIASLFASSFLLFEIYGAIVSDKTQKLFPKAVGVHDFSVKGFFVFTLLYSLILLFVFFAFIIRFLKDSPYLQILFIILFVLIIVEITLILKNFLKNLSK